MSSSLSAIWLYPIVIVAGLLQALGPPMNGQLRQSLVNPWLATLLSLGLVFAVFIIVAAMFPRQRRDSPPCPGGAPRRHQRCGRGDPRAAVRRQGRRRPVRSNDLQRQSHHVGRHRPGRSRQHARAHPRSVAGGWRGIADRWRRADRSVLRSTECVPSKITHAAGNPASGQRRFMG